VQTVKKKRVLVLIGGLGLTGLSSGSVFAQATGALEEIVVTAERREENLQATPISVAAFSAEQLRDLNVLDPRALTDFVPNFSMGNGTGRSNDAATISIRGLNEALANIVADPAVGIYIDDIYFGRPQVSFLKLIDVERVEVLRGPQGTLFGKNTTGGAVRYITKRPEFDKLSGYLSTTLGDYGEVDISGAVNVPVTDKVAVRLKAASLRQDGYVERSSDGQALGGDGTSYGSAQIRWHPSDRLDLNASLDYTTRNADLGPHKLIDYYRFNGAPDISPPVLSPGAASSAAWNFEWGTSPLRFAPTIPNSLYEVAGTGKLPSLHSKSTGFGLNIAYSIGDAITFRSITGYRNVEDTRLQDLDDAAQAYLILDSRTREGVDFWSQEIQFSGTHDRWNWVTGLYASQEEPFLDGLDGRDPRAATAFGAINIQNTSRQKTSHTAIYVQGAFDFTRRLELTAGIRQSQDEKTYRTYQLRVADQTLANLATQLALPPLTAYLTGCNPFPTGSCVNVPWTSGGDTFNSTTPRLALQYQWNDNIMTYVSASKGFKAGGTNDNPQDIGVAFQPETVLSYELGIRSEFANHRVRLNATYFTMDDNDKQITVAPTTAISSFINPCVGRCILNAGDAAMDGWELESVFAVTPRFQLHASAATLDARWTKIAPGTGVALASNLALAPKLSYEVGGRFDVPLHSGGTISLLLDQSFKDDQETSPQNDTTLTVPSYHLMTLRAKFTNSDGRIEAGVFCTNCTDEQYIIGGSAWAGTTANTVFDYKPLNHPGFVAGGIPPYLVVVPDITYVLVGAPRMWGLDFKYNF
jgi:iron complex outermembrane receptor protein